MGVYQPLIPPASCRGSPESARETLTYFNNPLLFDPDDHPPRLQRFAVRLSEASQCLQNHGAHPGRRLAKKTSNSSGREGRYPVLNADGVFFHSGLYPDKCPDIRHTAARP